MSQTLRDACLASLNAAGETYYYYSLAELAKTYPALVNLPYSLKVLLENLLRNEDGGSVTTADIEALNADVRHFDPLAALDGGLDGLDCWRILCPQIKTLLADEGMAFVEIGAGQGKALGLLGANSKLHLAGSFADLWGHERCLQFQKEI